MEDIILHVVVIAPITKWLMGEDRYWNKDKRAYGIYLAFLLLLVVGIFELRKSDQNFYEVLNLNSYATKTDIQQSFRQLTRIYHPDKNRNSDSIDDFNKIREAYEVLSNEAKKDFYDRFGDYGEGEVSNFFYVEILIIAIFQFAISFIFGFLYTYGKDNENCRMIICLYITLNFCIEIIFRFSPESTRFFAFLPILCHYTPYERIHAFRVLVPLVMNFVLLLDAYFLEDEDNSYILTDCCEYIFDANTKIIKDLDDAIIYFARLVDGMVDTYSNFSWRTEKCAEQFGNISELTDEQTYIPYEDNDDRFFSALKALEKEKGKIDLKIPKKELCQRFDWSRCFINKVLAENTKQKDFIQSTAAKGILFSSAIYFLGLISHLLSK